VDPPEEGTTCPCIFNLAPKSNRQPLNTTNPPRITRGFCVSWHSFFCLCVELQLSCDWLDCSLISLVDWCCPKRRKWKDCCAKCRKWKGCCDTCCDARLQKDPLIHNMPTQTGREQLQSTFLMMTTHSSLCSSSWDKVSQKSNQNAKWDAAGRTSKHDHAND
jgi:hypothetical protein